MRSINQLVTAAALVLRVCDDSVLTTRSIHQTLLFALPLRPRLPSFLLTRAIVQPRTSGRTLSASRDGNEQQPDEWLSIASKIREEVRELEAAAALSRQGKRIFTNELLSVNTADYLDIANSVWALSYRFANVPEDSNEKYDENSIAQRRLFGGKVTVKYRQDGYTDIVSQESYGSTMECCNIIKAWGWDIELSKDNENDDNIKDQEYILFSLDVEFPTTKGGLTTPTKQRFYFQARKDTDGRTGIITLADGSVTVKRDIVQKSTRWGFFSPAGILAQFRYVGGFVAKPVRMTVTD